LLEEKEYGNSRGFGGYDVPEFKKKEVCKGNLQKEHKTPPSLQGERFKSVPF